MIKTRDGKEFSEYLEYPKGDPREPMTEEDLDSKFNALSEELLSSERQKEIKEAIFNCENYDTGKFMEILII